MTFLCWIVVLKTLSKNAFFPRMLFPWQFIPQPILYILSAFFVRLEVTLNLLTLVSRQSTRTIQSAWWSGLWYKKPKFPTGHIAHFCRNRTQSWLSGQQDHPHIPTISGEILSANGRKFVLSSSSSCFIIQIFIVVADFRRLRDALFASSDGLVTTTLLITT